MGRARISAAFLLLLCAVIQGCGPQEDPTQEPGSEAREGTEVTTVDEHVSASPDAVAPAEPSSDEEASVSASSEVLLSSYESDSYIEGFTLDYQGFLCPGCNSSIRVEHWTRACRLCSYRKYADYRVYPGQSLSSCNDGRRTRVNIYGAYSDRSLYYWNFNFWNCS
jgi:hypothetical protein